MAAAAAEISMRASFDFGSRALTHWFPGHMAKGLREMQRQSRRCSCVIEVCDARMPFLGRNARFELLSNKPRLVVLTKADLAEEKHAREVEARFRSEGHSVLFVDCSRQTAPGLKHLLPRIQQIVRGPQQREREDAGVPAANSAQERFNVLVAGLPNVGKSSLINAMRRRFMHLGNCAPTGNMPGVTRAVQMEIKISENPLIYVIDTPGVMIPNIESPEAGMTMAILGTMKDDLVGEEYMADYLLFTLNKRRRFEYVDKYRIPGGATDDVGSMLSAVARRIGALEKGGVENTVEAARRFLRDFRTGELGRFSFL
eukprot:m.41647 g.41647  ORF g.41647 m.41647 type:complete len:314 (+) comp12031_c0_seq1:100-1041(+)